MTPQRYRGRPEVDPRPRRLWLVTEQRQPGPTLLGRIGLTLAYVAVGMFLLTVLVVIVGLGYALSLVFRWVGGLG